MTDFQIPALDGSRFSLPEMLRAYQEFEAFKKNHDPATSRARLAELGKKYPLDLMFGFYALTKVMPEPDVMNLPAGTGAVLRFTNVYGPEMRPDAPRVLMEKISRGEAASLADHSRYFVSWKDIVAALRNAGERLRTPSEHPSNSLVHVVPSGDPVLLEDLYRVLLRVVDGLIGGIPALVAPKMMEDPPALRIPKISSARFSSTSP